VKKCAPYEGALFLKKPAYVAGGLERVEKVEPDPWNLSVNTVVGKQR